MVVTSFQSWNLNFLFEKFQFLKIFSLIILFKNIFSLLERKTTSPEWFLPKTDFLGFPRSFFSRCQKCIRNCFWNSRKKKFINLPTSLKVNSTDKFILWRGRIDHVTMKLLFYFYFDRFRFSNSVLKPVTDNHRSVHCRFLL